MTLTLIIASISLAGLIGLIFFKPSVLVRGRSINIYWLAPLIGAVLLVALRVLSPNELADGLLKSSGMDPVRILVLLISMTLISIYLDCAGFFGYIAAKLVLRAGGSTLKLFFLLYAVVSVLTFFTSNDIIVLTFTPFICYFARNARIDPVPFLVCEFVAANTWSMALLIGNPTNIYLATNAGVEFMPYLKAMLAPTLAAGAVSLAVMLLLFRKRLAAPIVASAVQPKLTGKFHVATALVHLTAAIVLMSVSLYISLPMWLISLGACLSLVLSSLVHSIVTREPPKLLLSTLSRAPWDIIPFVVSMFTIVLAFTKTGVTDALAGILSGGDEVFAFGAASFVSANVINNIPMSVLFSPVCAAVSAQSSAGALFASIIGSNIGAFLTPIGAIAGIMWMSLLKLQRIKFGYVDFIKYGSVISLATLLSALFALKLELLLF